MSETFVDVQSRGVELGRRLHLSEIGPTGAYLEHPTPMPVGSELRVTTDSGVELGVVVVRVCEQVAGADRSPGMFVRVVEMSGDGEVWWNEHRTTEDDPMFPEMPRILPIAQRPTLRLEKSEIDAVTHQGLQRPPAGGLNARESEVPEEPEHGDPDGSNGAGSTLQGISAVAALAAAAEGGGKVVRDVAATMKMTPEQIKSITDLADDESNGESDKPRKRRRKKKKKS